MFTGPNINRKGLVIALDAASQRSYSGSDSTWYGLAGKDNEDFTLNNSSATSSYQGGIVFSTSGWGYGDGTFIENNFVNNQSVTVEAYLEITGYPAGNSGIYSNQNYKTETNPGGFGVCVQSDGSSYVRPCWMMTSESGSTESYQIIESLDLDLDTPYHICYSYNNAGNKVSSYLNGELQGTTTNENYHWTTSSASPAPDVPRIASSPQGGWGNKLPSIFYMLRVYDRALTDKEIENNYNSVKSRFGK